ncbi:hypothetical protein Tco_0905123 [Tanacetum coccineum]
MFFSPSPTPCGASDLLLGQTYTLLSNFNDSSPDYEAFCFDIGEKSSGNTTSQSDHSLPEYEAFCFDIDHIEEKISGTNTTNSVLSLPEYEYFHLALISERRVVAVPILSPIILFQNTKHSVLISIISKRRVVAIEFPEIDLLVSFPSENEDKVFDPGILIIDEVFSEVVRFDPFLSLTQSVSMTRVMETPSSGFHHMPSPRPAAYSPKEVMYRFYHPHLTSGDGFDHGPKMK